MKRFLLGIAIIIVLVVGYRDWESQRQATLPDQEIYIPGQDKSTTKGVNDNEENSHSLLVFTSNPNYVKLPKLTDDYTVGSDLLPPDFTAISFEDYAVIAYETELKHKAINEELAAKRVIWSGYIYDVTSSSFTISIFPSIHKYEILLNMNPFIKNVAIGGPIDSGNLNQFANLSKDDFVTVEAEVGIHKEDSTKIALFNTRILRVNDQIVNEPQEIKEYLESQSENLVLKLNTMAPEEEEDYSYIELFSDGTYKFNVFTYRGEDMRKGSWIISGKDLGDTIILKEFSSSNMAQLVMNTDNCSYYALDGFEEGAFGGIEEGEGFYVDF